ncbi:MAG: hypothetical protein BJ554DRAFT_6265 [Olpidium bornovanus]|uniref:Uncharacterized protein n=1 Tax=Olpidium bornovanus TaxID=278681 RepID=A0A8H8DKC2_9FUNG|nr:MAG: hypothetical protein BJ554DRAFT_6265 [Olpidium bornovanus]
MVDDHGVPGGSPCPAAPPPPPLPPRPLHPPHAAPDLKVAAAAATAAAAAIAVAAPRHADLPPARHRCPAAVEPTEPPSGDATWPPTPAARAGSPASSEASDASSRRSRRSPVQAAAAEHSPLHSKVEFVENLAALPVRSLPLLAIASPLLTALDAVAYVLSWRSVPATATSWVVYLAACCWVTLWDVVVRGPFLAFVGVLVFGWASPNAPERPEEDTSPAPREKSLTKLFIPGVSKDRAQRLINLTKNLAPLGDAVREAQAVFAWRDPRKSSLALRSACVAYPLWSLGWTAVFAFPRSAIFLGGSAAIAWGAPPVVRARSWLASTPAAGTARRAASAAWAWWANDPVFGGSKEHDRSTDCASSSAPAKPKGIMTAMLDKRPHFGLRARAKSVAHDVAVAANRAIVLTTEKLHRRRKSAEGGHKVS